MRIVTFEGRQHSFPADATDEEIAAALEGAAPAVPVKRGVYTRTDGQVGGLQKELDSEYANLKGAPDEEARQLAARNIIALRRTLGNKATDMPNIAGDANPDYVALLDMMDREEGKIGKVIPKPVAAAPRASQADVRRTEPKPLPMAKQRDDEADFAKQTDAWMKATGGVLKDGQDVRAAVAEWSGRQDPATRRQASQTEHLRETGELDGEDDTVGMQVVKPAAAMAGFALGSAVGVGGPLGATAAEAAVRYVTVASAVHKAVDAGAITADEGGKIIFDKLAKGVGMDALFNFGLPLVGQIAAKVPGAGWIKDKVGALIEKAAASKAGQAVKGAVDDAVIGAPGVGGAPRPSQRDVKLADRANDLPKDDVVGRKAVETLGKHSKDVVPTPGQVLDDAGTWETNVRKAHPKVFAKQDKQMEEAANAALRETTNPTGQQMSRETIGESIANITEATQKKVKTRLRPVFNAADNVGVQVDMSPVQQVAKAALAKDAAVLGKGKLTDAERAHLQSIVDGTPMSSAEGALDFLSVQKQQLRKLNQDGKPTPFFETVTTKLTKAGEDAYDAAARSIPGGGKVVDDLIRGRHQYREMMETVYEDAVKKALKEDPEAVGRLFWRTGNVSEIKQLHNLLRMARREGVLDGPGIRNMEAQITRGFLQEAVPNAQAAANWSKKLAESPTVRDTWAALTSAPGGKELRNTMEVIERAAQMALRDNHTLATQGLVPLQRAGSGSLGVSNVSVKPGWIITGLSLTGLTRAAATTYTQGEKGVGNLISRALRANGAGTAASAKVLQETLPKLYEWAQKNGMEDELFEQQPVQ
jgi:hypothetical protein